MVDEPGLTGKLASSLDDSDLRQVITDDREELRYRLRRVFRTLAYQPGQSKPLLLVLDDFEQNLEADCKTLKPSVAQVLTSLLEAIGECGVPHRLLVTCRYEFLFSRWDLLWHQPIAKFKDGDWKKKCAQLGAFSVGSFVPKEQQQRALRLADGNPKLAEWLDKILTESEVVDVEAILSRLEGENQQELREQVLAEELLAQMDDPMRQMLQRGWVFELPVPLAALREVCQELHQLDQSIQQALALGLLETDRPNPDVGQSDLPVRVPRVLPLEAVVDQESAAVAARVLFRLWWQEAETSTEAQRLEMHRLGVTGRQEEVALPITIELSRVWNNKCQFKNILPLCRSTLEVSRNHVVLHRLARSEDILEDV